jgi:hypothetical protein
LPIAPQASRTKVVRAVSGLSRSLARWVQLACAVGALLAIAAPAALGPALGPILRDLGAQQEHLCKCGMATGKCGCPECARAERERLRERMPDVVPVLKDQCDKDAPAMAFAALPMAALAAASVKVPVPAGERVSLRASDRAPAQRDVEPPTPPPRIASV